MWINRCFSQRKRWMWIQPTAGTVWFWLNIYGLQQNYEAQADQYRALRELEPDNPEYSFNLAITLLQQNDLKGALKVYDHMEARYGVIEEIVLQKELIYVKLGDIDRAAAELEKTDRGRSWERAELLVISRIVPGQ